MSTYNSQLRTIDFRNVRPAGLAAVRERTAACASCRIVSPPSWIGRLLVVCIRINYDVRFPNTKLSCCNDPDQSLSGAIPLHLPPSACIVSVYTNVANSIQVRKYVVFLPRPIGDLVEAALSLRDTYLHNIS